MSERRIVLVVCLAWIASVACAHAEDTVDFTRQVQPIFVEHCAKCHGETKAQSKMRLDTAAGIEEKLAAKPQFLVAGKPEESLLYQRLVLPADNPKRMPKGADPLSQEAIALVATWIKQGALLKAAAVAVPASASESTDQTANQPAAEKPALPEVAAAPQEAVDQLVAAGTRVVPLYAGSNLLEISFAGRSEPVGDSDVALLAGVAEQVYSLNLANAKISAAGLQPLSALKNLTWLHLEHATVGDDALVPLSGLSRLQYLNLYGTTITDAGLKHVTGLKQLSRLYLWQTKVSYDPAMALEKEIPGLIVNLGYDHPEVARRRLTKELESAKAGAEKAKQALERAKKDAETTAARLDEIEKQLKALKAPADGS